MNSISRRSLTVISTGLGTAAMLSALLLAPTTALGQVDNTSSGYEALSHNTTGSNNTATGFFALNSNTTGIQNTATGSGALAFNLTGDYLTATGINALMNNTTGGGNTATGNSCLYTNTTGYQNTAAGGNSMYYNTNGYYNAAFGNYSLYANTTGFENAAFGYQALTANTTGHGNTGTGMVALYSNTTGYQNTSSGVNSLWHNTSGYENAAYGNYALFDNTTGDNNIGIGFNGGEDITTGSYNVDIANVGSSTDAGIMRIGTNGNQTETFIAGISGDTSLNGVAVYINANGRLGTLTSSRRFKFDIKNIGATSDKLMDLRPVAFRYKQAAEDGSHPLQYGLIAEEVAKVYPQLVQYGKDGKPFTVYYNLLTPMMLNELQKAHKEIAALQAEHSQTASLQTQVGSLNSQVQSQSTQVASLQHANLLFMGLIALILIGGAVVLLRASAQKRELPALNRRTAESFA